MHQTTVLLHVDPRGVATVTLNRAELHNAIDDETASLLTATLETLADDDSVRVVVLTGSGISFSAGHDSDWMRHMASFSEAELRHHAQQLSRLLRTLDTLPKPTIARIPGSAFGLGAGLVACCDIAIGASEALFSFSDVKLGVIPALSAPYVVRAIGPRAARRYFVSAERFNAGKAKRLGLLHQVVELDELDSAVEHCASHLLINGPNAMRAAKQLIALIDSRELDDDLLEDTIDAIVKVRASEEGREGIHAFLEQRKPNWLD
ncbi:enoyl-CoA hydratase/isomerase family protein [Crenobacter sp. SG2305]|uniref:enoyl-CoA hydratase/isomerase family protein n=1 Tax=Crenobacter oryzisoli TaxID=3056844 RepID=UPI0025AA695E|nr:enoyl-CoA hydratase/isomerase family protein [Crenobacter sp. SG2305]MDN0082266.1 enoyl-CoA hydratase/isomerase family protein [Crenobacter sp. SG2305]